MASQTPNYNLDLYETGDAAALTDQYNSAIRKIDTDLKTFNQGITSASQLATTANNTANANKANLKALGITDTNTATSLKNKIDSTATTANTAKSTADANTAKLNALGVTDTTSADKLEYKINSTEATANANKANLKALGVTSTTNATELKTKIDSTATTANTAKSTADANTAKLNALGVTDTTSAGALKTTIANNTNNIATLTSVVNTIGYRSGVMLTFGDSYSAAENQEYTWTYQLHQFLPQLTWKNYGQSGAGFNVSGLLFIDQIMRAVNDTSFKNTDVALCVLAGGRNDILDYGNAKNRMQTCINTLLSNFPNAHIVIAPMLWDSAVLRADNRPKLTGLQDPLNKTAGYTPRLCAINYAYLWLKGSTDLLQPSGNIHPNELGAKTIAQYLLQGAHHRYVPRAEITNTNIGGATGSVSLNGGTCTLDVMGNIDNIGNGQGATLPGWAASIHNVWVWGVSRGSVTEPHLYSINGTKFEMYEYSGQTGNAAIQMTYEA